MRFSGMRKRIFTGISLLPLAALGVAVLLVLHPVEAAGALLDDNSSIIQEISGSLSAGYHHYNPKGNRSKVGEYDVLEPGMDSSFNIMSRSNGKYFNMNGQYLDDDDLSFYLNMDINRYFRSDISFTRFQHFLEYNPLTNQDYVNDFNKGADSKLLIQELKADNTLLVPQLPFLKFNFDYRSYQKRGHKQATTIGKCSQCHVTSRNKRVDTSTNDVVSGLEATFGPATVSYSHLLRDFTEHADAPMANYGDGASFFLVKGAAPYSMVPDSRMNVDTVSLRSALPWQSTIYANVQHGTRKNRTTGDKVTFNSFATRLSKYFSRYLSFDAFYNMYKLENKSHNGIDIDTERGGFDMTMHPVKNSALTCSYQWTDTDRDNADWNSTRKNIYRISWSQRLAKKVRLNMYYRKTRVNDPLVMKDQTFNDVVQTSLPQKEDELYGTVSWSPRYNLTLNASLRYTDSRSSRYNSDEDRWEYVAGFWYVPYERLTLTGSFTLSTTDVNTSGTLKTYHLTGSESLYKYNDFPYDGKSQAWFFSANYLLTSKITLAGDISLVRSKCDFDKRIDGSNQGSLSDISIGQVETAFGISYAWTRSLTMHARYMFREYDDHEENYYDGRINLISVGASWSF